MTLLSSIKHLGFKTGWRYWRLFRAAKKDPQIVLDIISNLAEEEKNAKGLEKFDLFALKTLLKQHYYSWQNYEALRLDIQKTREKLKNHDCQ